MSLNQFYYLLKPFIPRAVQIALRRRLVLYKSKRYSHIWPIDPNAGDPPENWPGWPESKQFALVLSHDVDTQRGHDNVLRLAELEMQLGFRSSFNFVPERYSVSPELRNYLVAHGFGVGVHGLKHDGKLFLSEKVFMERAIRINQYLKDWGVRGFTSPSTHHNLSWMHALDIDYDISTFDTDPFEPQPDGMGTIFPFPVYRNSGNSDVASSPRQPRNSGRWYWGKISKEQQSQFHRGRHSSFSASQPPRFFIELPYTIPQDFTLFVLMQEQTIDIWKRKLHWIAERGGMALLNTHSDYIDFDKEVRGKAIYPIKNYIDFLEYLQRRYEGRYFHASPSEIADFWARNYTY